MEIVLKQCGKRENCIVALSGRFGLSTVKVFSVGDVGMRSFQSVKFLTITYSPVFETKSESLTKRNLGRSETPP